MVGWCCFDIAQGVLRIVYLVVIFKEKVEVVVEQFPVDEDEGGVQVVHFVLKI